LLTTLPTSVSWKNSKNPLSATASTTRPITTARVWKRSSGKIMSM